MSNKNAITRLLKDLALAVDKLPVLYLSKQKGAGPEDANHVLRDIAESLKLGQTAEERASFFALLQKAAMAGYPLAQLECAKHIAQSAPDKSNLARAFYTMLRNNSRTPAYMINAIPAGMTIHSQTLRTRSNLKNETALTHGFRNSTREIWWQAAKLDEITGIRNPDDFIRGDGLPAVLPYVPELLLATYNIPATNCVEDQYIKDIYGSVKNKEDFYKTVAHYRLPRLSWADRIKVPVAGALSKLGLSKDFVSEGHKMCATADVIVMLLSRELYVDQGTKFSSLKALARQTLEQMGRNGFPAAQLALASYLRNHGLQRGDLKDVEESIKWAKMAAENTYTTSNEKAFLKKTGLMKNLTQEQVQSLVKIHEKELQRQKEAEATAKQQQLSDARVAQAQQTGPRIAVRASGAKQPQTHAR